MLDPSVKRKLETIKELPTLPTVLAQVLNAIEDEEINASKLSAFIEKDQALTARILRVANSPFYGFVKKISTVDLAVVVLGMDTIKEIIISLVLRNFVTNKRVDFFDISSFWKYSVFCGASSRLLARKLNYRLVGEAFVAGLMHDIGILIIVEFFTSYYFDIINEMRRTKCSILDAERKILGATHCEIGDWIARKWNLPEGLNQSILNHHTPYSEIKKSIGQQLDSQSIDFVEIEQPLTAIVSISEWFAEALGFKKWDFDSEPLEYYLSTEIFSDITENDLIDNKSAFNLLKNEILEEYNKASILIEMV